MSNLEKRQQEFIEFEKELKSFIYRMIPHKQEAEDISQETYIKAFKNLDSFEEKSSYKTWVFSIATNLVKDNFKARQRWGEDWQDLGREYNLKNEHVLQEKICTSKTTEHGKFVIREHISFCFTCINKTLPLVNQICLLLKEVYSFKIREITIIIGLTEGKVKHAIADARKDMLRIFKNRCTLINKKGICHQCTELNNKFNPEHNAQKELNKIKLVKEATKKNHQFLLNLRLELLRTIDPLNAEGTNLHNFMLENCPDWAKSQTLSLSKK